MKHGILLGAWHNGESAMNICIVSWGEEAHKVYSILESTYEVSYIIERECELWKELRPGLQGISFAKAYRFYNEGIIDAFLIPCMRGINVKTGIYDRLIRNHVADEDILYAPLRIFKDDILTEEEKRKMICRFSERKEIDFLAMHIVEGCNLNCSNCSVFSGLCSADEYIPITTVKESVDILSELFDQIVVFRILGGEPLLHPQWMEICRYVREKYPFADVEIVTNGTLVHSVSDDVLTEMNKNNIVFDITDYPLLGDRIDTIHEKLCRFKVTHYITQEAEFFSRLYNFTYPGDAENKFGVCKAKFMCMNLREYNLTVCHAAIGLSRAKKVFPEIQYKETGIVDIRTKNLTPEMIIRELDRPHDMCRYCNQDLVKWHGLTEKNDKREWGV